MVFKFFLLFTVVPFLELALLIKIGTLIGTFDTILIVIITGLVGAVLVRAAGIQCLWRIRRNMNEGVFPGDELFNGVLILVAGAFLITPGLMTDAAGFILLVPFTREPIKRSIKRYVSSRIQEVHIR